MTKIFEYAKSLDRRPTHYCPGCTHGVTQRLVAEILDELGVRENTVGVAPVGCSVFVIDYFDCDMFLASHGRAPAVATGAKRSRPELTVFSYQGDGDMASIGTAEIIHAANRGEKFTAIFVNNAIYGMTGGQMAPTTLPNQRTTTCVSGRNVETAGYPIRMSEMLASLATPGYIARVSTHSAVETINAKNAIREAFQHQLANRCFSFVEVLSICPTNWGLSTRESGKWLEKEMLPFYTLGVKKRPLIEQGEKNGND